MKYFVITLALTMICALPVQADNNIMIGLDSVPNYMTEFYVPFLFENDVPLEAFSNGFTITANGNITAEFGDEWQITVGSRLDGIYTGFWVGIVSPDSILCGAAVLIPWPDPLPAGPLEELFSYEVLVTKNDIFSEGEICIDSVIKVGAAGDWLWDDGSGNIDPTFNEGNGAHCIIYYTPEMLCGDVTYDSKVNVSDVVYLINYIFSGGPIPEPYSIGDANCDGSVNLGDVVYITRYVFRGGNPPCDTDGNGIPEC